jgi:hypothetical protein
MRLTDTQRHMANILYANSGMTREDLYTRLHPNYRKQNINYAIDTMLRQDMIEVEANGTITMSAWLIDIAESAVEREKRKGAIVKAAEPPIFRPLSAQGTRDDAPVREFHPVPCGSNVSPHSVEY